MVLCQVKSAMHPASINWRVCKCWYFEGPTKRLTESLMTWRPLRPLDHLYSEREMCCFRLDLALAACKLMNNSEEQHSSNCEFFNLLFYYCFLNGAYSWSCVKWNQPCIQPVSTGAFVSVGISKDRPRDWLSLLWHDVPFVHLTTYTQSARCAASG